MRKITVLILILIPTLVLAQGLSGLDGQSYVKKGSRSLFDPSRLSISQSYSLGYYSGGGVSGSIGYYMNSLEYRFSNPLKIRVDLGYLHSPTNLFSNGSSGLKSGVFVPGFSVDWRPTKGLNFRLDYRRIPVINGSGFGLNPYLEEDNR